MPSGGASKLPRNIYAERLVENKQREKEQVCEKHSQQFVLYCNKKSCEELACSSCVLAKHKDHINEITDIPDKAEKIKDQMRDLKKKCSESEKCFAVKINYKKNLIEKMKITSTKTLKEIDHAHDQILQKVNKAAEELKQEVLHHQQEQLELVDEECNKLTKRRETDLKYAHFIAILLESNDDFNIIKKSSDVQKAFDESEVSGSKAQGKEWDPEVLSFVAKKHINFKDEVLGHIRKTHRYTDIKSNIKEDLSKLKQLWPISGEEHKSWKGHGYLLSGNNTEFLYLVGAIDEARILKVFDIDGIEKRCIRIRRAISQLLYIEGGDRNMLLTKKKVGAKYIELRNAKDPSQILDSIASAYGDYANCQTSGNSIMLGQWADGPSTAAEYEITDGKFGKLKRKIKIPLKKVYGFAAVSCGAKKLLVMTSWKEKTIQAIDYITSNQVWRLRDVECDGKVISPCGICSDGAGHLFVADGPNKRILTLNTSGTELRKLTDTESNAHGIVWIGSQRKLVISSTQGPCLAPMVQCYSVTVYNVKYTGPTRKRNIAIGEFTEATMGPSGHKRACLPTQQPTVNLADGTPSTSQE